MILSLLLSLFIFLPDLIESNCHDHRYGVPSKSCKRIKDPKFQIRGDIKIVPMWEFILMKEPTSNRVKRATPTHQNGTLHAAHSGGRTVLQPLPLPPQKWNQNYVPPPTQPARHHTLIQPVDSNPPLPAPQRHIVERQVLPVIHPAPVYNLHPYPAQSNTAQNYRRPDTYTPNAPPPPRYPSGVPNQSQYQGYPPQNVPRQPSPQLQQRPVTNYNQPPQQRLPYPNPRVPQFQVSPGNQVIENSNWSNRNGGKYQKPINEGGSRNGNKKEKKKKGKKGKSSKMCKMCKELSEEDSEEKEVACDFCKKSSQKKKGKSQSKLNNGKVGGKTKNKGNGSDESPEGEGAQIENITEDGDDDYYDENGSTTETPTTVSQPTIIDFAKRAEQNKLMRIPVYRGKKLENKDSYNTGSDENGDEYESKEEDDEKSEFSSNIREAEKPTKYSDKPNVKYSYPPKDTLPLQTCFHNPSGYVCCNLELNNVVESTYKEIKELPNFNPCNLQLIANKLQRATEKMFEHPFESVVSHADFAQNINFAGDLVCKLEIDGKYMIAYGTPYHADEAVGPQGPDGNPLPVRSLKL